MEIHRKRLCGIYALTLLLFAFLILRMYFLATSPITTEVLGAQYSRGLPVCRRVGFILDRNGVPLNMREGGYICLVIPGEVKDKRRAAGRLCEISGTAESVLAEKMLAGAPFTVVCSVPYRKAEEETEEGGDGKAKKKCAVKEKEEFSVRLSDKTAEEEKGIVCFPLYEEVFGTAIHTVGYADKTGSGRCGIRLSFGDFLTGTASGRVAYRYEADIAGIPLTSGGSVLYNDGYTEVSGVCTTPDASLQAFCERAAREELDMGGVVVTDLQSGEVLSSVSVPSFEAERAGEYLESARGEFVDRTRAAFTPGSLFKTVVAAAALEISQGYYDKVYDCRGYYEVDGLRIGCHEKAGHGECSMKEAYALSCNCYFLCLASEIGAEAVEETAHRMGLGNGGTLFGVGPYGGNIPEAGGDEVEAANMAIGQGKVLMSLYEAANLFSCASIGGYYEPLAVKALVLGKEEVRRFYSEYRPVLSERTAEKLREMMAYCVSDGLGKEARSSALSAGGKTATAQTGRFRDGKELLNTWFCGVYPMDEPRFAICVLCDGEGEGGDPKALFRRICDRLYGQHLESGKREDGRVAREKLRGLPSSLVYREEEGAVPG